MLLVGTSAKVVTTCGVLGWAALILTTYTLCVHQGHCIRFLPMISDTWVYPPENYISRMGVSFGCFFVGLAQVIIYWINNKDNDDAKLDKKILFMGLLGSISLSWVGAICESRIPTCDSNGHIHSAAAVFFFILFDINMILTVKSDKYTNTRDSRRVIVWICLLTSLLAKLRWVVHSDFVERHSLFMPLLEWSDVGSVLLFTLTVVLLGGDGLAVGFVSNEKQASKQENTVTLSSFDANQGVSLTVSLWIFVLSSALYYATADGTVKPLQKWPYFDDLFVSPIGNYVSRWGIPLASTFATITHFCDYFRVTSTTRGGSNMVFSFVTSSAVSALFCLSVSGCANDQESASLHSATAFAFYFVYTVSMLVSTAYVPCSNTRKSLHGIVRVVACVVCVVCKARFSSRVRSHIDPTHLDAVCAIMEWLDMAGVLSFMWAQLSGNATYGFGVVKQTDESDVEVFNEKSSLLHRQ